MKVHGGSAVHELIADLARTQPDRTAVVFGDEQVDYAALDARVKRLACHLQNCGVVSGSVVMVHLERSIDTIVGLLATFKAGAAYLPVERGVPESRVDTYIKETGCETVIAEPDDFHRFAGLPVSTIAPDTRLVAASSTENAGAAVQLSDPAYVIYTSGSTGVPKGVVVDHRSLSYLCGEVRKRFRIRVDDRVLQFAALSFDTSLEQILVTLTSGATLVLPEMMWAPSELSGKLIEHAITVMDLTPAYWRSFLAELDGKPVDLPVRLAIVGGEAVRTEDCRTSLRLMPAARLVNAYGLTETTVTSCTMELSADVLSARGNVPVGLPLPGSTIHILDEQLRPVGPGERGEVCIGGLGVARGYVAEEPSGRERFLPDPFTTRPGARMFRTGDLGAVSSDGHLEVFGRTDRQIKIRGFRVEPGEIEAVLATHPVIEDIVVAPHDHNGQRRLVGYFTMMGNATETPTAKELRAFTAEYLPDYMVPTVFIGLPEMPLKSNGKVDLSALPEPEWTTATAEVDDASTGGAIDRAVAGIWRKVLGAKRVGQQDNFFDLGGNSISVAELMAKVRASLGVHITQVRPLIRLLLEDATLHGFTQAVRAARAGTLDGDDTRKTADFASEAVVGVPVNGATAGQTEWQDPQHIFLTGSSGFFGVYLLRELLRTTDAVVHCLVRAHDGARAMRRIQSNAVHYFGEDLAEYCAAGRIVPVVGDLAAPLLGMSEADFDGLARVVDVIHHPGGLVNFIYPYSHMSPVNVSGTREVIRMAGRHRNAPVHYTSTMAVIAGFGTAGTRHVTEQTPLGHADHLSVGYVESKWVAEALLRNAAKEGLPVAVYRAADISGDCVTGAWNTSTEMCAMKKFVVDTGLAPIAALPLDYTPVDRYAAAVAHIARRSLPAGEVYHLTNPNKAYVDDLAERLRVHGHQIREVPWHEWVDAMVDIAVERPDHPMTPFAPLFIDRCAAGTMSVAEMYLETTFPEFTRANVEKALHGSGIEIPPVDTEMIDRYLRYLTSIGFL